MTTKLAPGTQVRVYRNLRNHTLSIQTHTKNGWRVYSHTSAIALKNAHFHVSAKGNARVRRTGRKNVHAWITGTVTDPVATTKLPFSTYVIYNPKHHHQFQTHSGTPIHTAALVHVHSNGAILI